MKSSNYKYHTASNKLADFILENNSCSELTPILKKHGIFDWKHENDGSLTSMFMGKVPVRLVPVNDFQGAVEANSSIGLLTLREILVNADEANLELDHALFDLDDYFKVMNSKTYDTIYGDISNMMEAHAKFGNSQKDKLKKTQQRNLFAVIGKDSKFRKLHIQDMGVGRCGDEFESALTLKGGKPSTKGVCPWFIGRYNFGQKAISATQNPKTLRYRGAFSKRHPDLLDDFTQYGDHWHLSLSVVLSDEVFEEGGSLDWHTSPTRSSSTYTLYRLEFQMDDGNWRHPICSADYHYNPTYKDKDTYNHFENPTHGTTIFIFDSNLHKNSAKVSNVEDASSFYHTNGLSVLSSSVNQIHPSYVYPISVIDVLATNNQGGNTSTAYGFESKVENNSKIFEKIPLDDIFLDLLGKGYKTKIPVTAYYRNDVLESKKKKELEGKDFDDGHTKKCSHSGTAYKVNDYYAQFDRGSSNQHKFGLPNGLHNYIRVIVDFNNASKEDRKKFTQARRDNMDLDHSIADILNKKLKSVILANPRIQAIIADWSDSDSKYNSHEVLNLFNAPFLKSDSSNGCRSTDIYGIGTGIESDPNMDYKDRISWLQVNDRTLTSKKSIDADGNVHSSKMKHVGQNLANYHLRFNHDAKSDIVKQHGFKVDIRQSFDNGDTWSDLLNYSMSNSDGELFLNNLDIPDSSKLNEDKTFITKVDIDFIDGELWVDKKLLDKTQSFLVDCFVEPKETFVRSNSDRTKTRNNRSNNKNGSAKSYDCLPKVNLIKELEELKNEDGDPKYFLSFGSENLDSQPMTEYDILGMRSEGGTYIVALNSVSPKYFRIRNAVIDKSEYEKFDHYLQEFLTETIGRLILNSPNNDLSDLSTMNHSFESSLKAVAHTWSQSCKKFLEEGIKRHNQAKKKAEKKAEKQSALRKKNIAKKKGSAKKKSTQKV